MMDKRGTPNSEGDKPNWDWSQVESSLKTAESGRRSSIWQLAPSILLTNPNSISSDPVVRLFIDTQKSLNYSHELGWNWHKSWNLPNISICLQIKDDMSGEQLLSPKNIYAQLFAVINNNESDRNEKPTLFDVGIRGENKIQMIDGQAYFSAMKFSSTTYNNQGQKFHLLITIYIQENENEKPKILTAIISPQIFVDSRRSARDYQCKKLNSFVEPFLPEQLEKQFIKRQNKTRLQNQIQISNDSQGLYNYLTAPNIRHKVKHPIFLAIRFSNCTSIFLNSQKMPITSQNSQSNKYSKQIIDILQRKLIKESQSKNYKQEPSGQNLSQKFFIFCAKGISDSLKRKKVIESIETLQSQSIGVLYGEEEISSEFVNLDTLGDLSQIYRENYKDLKQICRRYVPFQEDSSEYESQEEPDQRRNRNKDSQNLNKQNSFNQNKRAKANIICQTIPTIDHPYKQQDGNKNIEKRKPQMQKIPQIAIEIKKEEIDQKQMIYQIPVVENPNVSSNRNNININNGNPQNNKISLNIISKQTAFSNPKNDDKGNKQTNREYPTVNANAQVNQPNKNNNQPNINSHQNIFTQQQQQQPKNNYNIFSELNGLGQNLSQQINDGYGMGLGNMGGIGGMGSVSNSYQQNLNNILGGFNGLNPFGGMPGLGFGGGLNNLGLLNGFGGLGGFQGQNMNNFNSYGNLVHGQQQKNTNESGQNTEELNSRSLQNLFCNNLILSNWLNSIKNNNVNLYQSMKSSNQQPNQQHFTDSKNPNQQFSDGSRIPPQLQEQQSMLYLLQQINLYKQLLSQISYQNQLLGRSLQASGLQGISGLNQDIPQNPRNNIQMRNSFQNRDSQSREPKGQPK